MGLESRQKRNNPHRAQFIQYYSHKAAVERRFFDLKSQYTVQCVSSRSLRVIGGLTITYFIIFFLWISQCNLFCWTCANTVQSDTKGCEVIQNVLAWLIWHLFPTTTHTIRDQIPRGSLCHQLVPVLKSRQSKKCKLGRQWRTERKGHHTTRQEIGSGR